MWIERDWGPAVTALARAFPVVLVTGPRQVGKTSLLRHLYPAATYVTLDDPAAARQAETNPDTFLDSLPEPVVIDEVQYVTSLFRHLKRRVDQGTRRGRYLLTGSQTFTLMQDVSESLAGRCGVLEMSTLSLREVRRLAPDTDDIGFLVRGGFPALYTGLFERAADFYSSYVVTYLERDVRNIKAVGDLRDFDRFLRAAALRSGQILSYSDLARDVGVSANTAKSWVSVLEASGQIRLLEPYHRHLGKRLVKSPKLYFMDAGLACHLVGLTDVGALLASPLGGALFETLAIGQVVRHYQVDRNRPPIWFWRTGDGEEVDLLVERGGRFTAVECKLAETPKEEALRAFHALERYYGKGCVERAIVVCRTTRPWAFKSFRGARAVSVADVDGEL